MSQASNRLTQRLTTAPAWAFSAYAILAAFTTYFCMYGFRKGFAAGSYDEQTAGFFGSVFALKSVLVISQLIGYHNPRIEFDHAPVPDRE